MMGSMIDTLIGDCYNDTNYIEGHRYGSIPSLLGMPPLNTQPPALCDDSGNQDSALSS